MVYYRWLSSPSLAATPRYMTCKEQIPTGGPQDTLVFYTHSKLSVIIYEELWIEITMPVRLYQTIGRVHIPAEPIYTAGRVYRHFVYFMIADTTSLPNISDIINKKRHALFGHVVRLDASVHGHQAQNKSLQ